ncbi:hypothetical protein [Halobacillus ihumii]|uniref:hypothetical protein n=1 Tax=Halobacillus ihumii TaxID=2686092 RepID=UPI0013D8D89B|nr:hypothetical protein [Halobacillus ihumii]
MKRIGFLLISSSLLIMFTYSIGTGLNKQVSAENNTEIIKSDIKYQKNIDEALKEVGYKLYKEGYSFGMEYDILPNKNVEIEIKTADQKATENVKNEMKQIAMGVIKESKYEPKLFEINVTDHSRQEN